MGIKDSVKMHVEEFKAKKKILKEDAKTNYKFLWIGLLQMLWGFILFVWLIDNMYFKIGAKILGVAIFFNGIGFILKSRDIDIKVEEHSKRKAKEIWGREK